MLRNQPLLPTADSASRVPQSALSRALQHRSLLVRLVVLGTLLRMLRVLAPLLADLDAALALVRSRKIDFPMYGLSAQLISALNSALDMRPSVCIISITGPVMLTMPSINFHSIPAEKPLICVFHK